MARTKIKAVKPKKITLSMPKDIKVSVKTKIPKVKGYKWK